MVELTGFAQEIFLSKYSNNDESTWEQCAQRVAKHVSQAENGEQSEWNQKFFDIIKDMDFLPGGRVLAGSGKPRSSLLNCYALKPEDNVESLGNLLRDFYYISCGGGGCGFSFSSLRPRGDNIQNIKYSAPGVVSEIRKIDAIGNEIKCGGGRRVALLAILDCNHPDMLDFLHVKLDLNLINNFNISVGITNDFLKAISKDKEWKFQFGNRDYFVYEIDRVYRNGKKETIRLTAINDDDALGRAYASHKKNFTDKFENPKKIKYKAIDLWNQIIENAVKCGEPGLFNLDMVNSYTNVSYFQRMDMPNPCSEIPLTNYGSCVLGSINLSNMYDDKKNDVNWKKLAKTIRVAVRFLDDVITINNYPIPQTRTEATKSRKIGLGVTGLHYLLVKMGYKYGSESCLEVIERIFGTFRNEAYSASCDIAKEKGAFTAFDGDLYLKEEYAKSLPQRIRRKIKKYGVRNSTMLTCAPCGSISILAGVSSGIESIFSPIYKRRYRDTEDPSIWKETIVVDKLFQEFYKQGKDTQHIIGAADISPEDHMAVQATIQRFICSSISKTINLPSNITSQQLSSIVLEFIGDLKGVTLYKAGSRKNEPLQAINMSNKKEIDKIMKEANIESNSIDSCRSGKCEV